MTAINQMCQKALYLEKGRALSYGSVQDTTIEYHRNIIEEIEQGSWHRAIFSVPNANVEIYSERQGEVECLGGSVQSKIGEILTHLPIDQPIHIMLRYRVLKDLPFPLVPSFNVYDEIGHLLSAAPNVSAKKSAAILPRYHSTIWS
jgi:lipopolysaccharide transport system ATP-binding protein